MKEEIQINIKPNEKQEEFFMCRDKYILYGGAKGGGKSWAIRTKQILRRFMYPQSRGLLLRRTYPELLENHIYKIQEEWKGLDWNAKDARFIFPNGSYLKLGSAQFESDVMKYQGSEFEDIGIDEVTNFTEYQFNILRSCLRTTKKGIETQMYLGGNPGGVGHGWVKRRFINQQLPKHHFIPAKVYDNPVLMEADPDYMEELKMLPEDLRKAYLEGDWDVFSGQVFSEWHQQKHIVKTFDYPIELCKKTIGFDWGFNAPACALWLAHTPDERIYVYREIYQNGKNPEEWANMIKEYTSGEEVEKVILPHDCFSNVQGNKSIADTFEEIGVPNIVRAKTLNKNSRKNRVAIMHQYLSEAPDEKPYLQVHISCENLIRTLPELIYSETNPEDVSTDGEDHCLAGETPILTNKGWIQIKELPFSKVTGYDTMTMKIITESGRELICTPNHKIMTPTGWVKAEELAVGSKILSLFPKQYKNLMEEDITNVGITLAGNLKHSKVQEDYTELFGNFTMAKFQPVKQSTIKTGTPQTIESQISNSLEKENILAYIPLIQQRGKEKLEEETPRVLAEKVIIDLQEKNAVELVSWVGNAGKRSRVYDVGIEHWSHCFIAAGGLVVSNCYDALAVALLDKVLFSTNSGAVSPNKPFSGQRDWNMTPYGIESPDFVEAFKNEKTRRDWKYI